MSKGIALSVSASVLFAVMYYYTSLLTPLSGVEIFGWRMLLTVPCMTVGRYQWRMFTRMPAPNLDRENELTRSRRSSSSSSSSVPSRSFNFGR